MTKNQQKYRDRLRNKRNRDLIKRMLQGENLTLFNAEESWFPKRPVIEKDQDVIARLTAMNESIEDPASDENNIVALKSVS